MLVVCLALLPLAAVSAHADDMTACTVRRAALTKQAADFKGDATTKANIDRALRRAGKELAEGDGDECIEALDHVAKLLASTN
jgi:hypothetical protein